MPELKDLPPLLKPREVRELLRMSRRSVLALEQAGILHPIGIRPQQYRYKRDEVLKFMGVEV